MHICKVKRQRVRRMNVNAFHNAEEMRERYHVDIGYFQCNHEGERICGDVILSKRLPDEDRILCVLSDGMGHGVKANVFATLTSTILLNLSQEQKDAGRMVGILMKALPIYSDGDISYATYTIVDISLSEGTVSLLEYDNPATFILRGTHMYEPDWRHVRYKGDVMTVRGNPDLRACSFVPLLEDRIVFCTDGITQSGMGRGMAMGWGRNDLIRYVREVVEAEPDISSAELSKMIVRQASSHDQHLPKDDLTCAVAYFRKPRRTILCTGPPFHMEQDPEYAMLLNRFDGRKIISGATTTMIIARELRREVMDEKITDSTLPPSSTMEGIDLVTEGVLTLTKVTNLLNNIHRNPATQLGKGPADRIVRLLLDSDEIHFLVGTKINEYHHDPTLPVEIETRRNLIRRLAGVLTEHFMKVVTVHFM